MNKTWHMNRNGGDSLGRVPLSRFDLYLALILVATLVAGCVDAARRANVRTNRSPTAGTRQRVELTPRDVGLPELDDLVESGDFRIVRQPQDITATQYQLEWPWMAELFEDVGSAGRSDEALLARLDSLGSDGNSRYGALNFRAQLQRRAGQCDDAKRTLDICLKEDPDQHLHHFQAALIAMCHLERSENPIMKWRYSSLLQAAYERAFSSDSSVSAYRLYLCYALQLTPKGFGGDPDRALRLAEEGLRMGDDGFLVVRAELRLLRGRSSEALVDLDIACRKGLFRSEAFLRGTTAALANNDMARARRYAGFLIGVNPRFADNWIAAGKVCWAEGRRQAARLCFRQALSLAPDSAPALRAMESLQKEDEGK